MTELDDMQYDDSPEVEPTFALTSVQKVHGLLRQVGDVEVSGMDAIMLGAFTSFLPMLLARIPDDPVELDGLIDRARGFLAGLQSDPGAVVS